MDKASIVSDAISYVQDLQKQVDEIQADIASLQSSKDSLLEGPNDGDKDTSIPIPTTVPVKPAMDHKILEVKKHGFTMIVLVILV